MKGLGVSGIVLSCSIVSQWTARLVKSEPSVVMIVRIIPARPVAAPKARNMPKYMTAVGFEPTQLALVELESTPLDHSGKLS